MSKQFAYGYWTVAGVSCPVTQAGCKDHSHATELAEMFDSNVSEEIERNESQGVIAYNTAKEQFHRTKEYVETKANMEHGEYEEMYSEMLELAEEVEQEVFDDE